MASRCTKPSPGSCSGYDVFVSYPRTDGETLALALHGALRQRRYVSFLDRHEGLYGTDLKATLRSRLARSQALLVVATPASFASPHVEFEVASFVERHRSKPRPFSFRRSAWVAAPIEHRGHQGQKGIVPVLPSCPSCPLC
jgi:hypothetical protein